MRYRPQQHDGEWVVWDVVDEKPADIPGVSTSGLFQLEAQLLSECLNAKLASRTEENLH